MFMVTPAEVVERWAPMWAYSTFWFESLLRKYVHGTRFVSSQVGLVFDLTEYTVS